MLYSIIVCNIADLQICLVYMIIAHEVLSDIKKYNLVGVRFSIPFPTGPGAHPASYTMGTWSFPGCGIGHQPSSSAEVKERVELFLYSTSGPLWLVVGRTLPLP
jgi:hypothetical protein